MPITITERKTKFSQADLKQFAFAKSHLLLKVDKVVVGGLTLILLKGVRVLVGRAALPLPATSRQLGASLSRSRLTNPSVVKLSTQDVLHQLARCDGLNI